MKPPLELTDCGALIVGALMGAGAVTLGAVLLKVLRVANVDLGYLVFYFAQ